MKYSSADIFSAVEKVIQTEETLETREGEKNYDNLVNAIGDLQSVIDVVYRQENFNPELQDAYDIAKFVLEEMENKYEFEVWESHACCPSLEYTSVYTADAIRTFQKGDKNETRTAIAKANVLAEVLSDHSREVVHVSLKDAPAIERVNLTSVTKFVSSLIIERIQEERNTVESAIQENEMNIQTCTMTLKGQTVHEFPYDSNAPAHELLPVILLKHTETINRICENISGILGDESNAPINEVVVFLKDLFVSAGEREAETLYKALDDALSSYESEPATDKAA